MGIVHTKAYTIARRFKKYKEVYGVEVGVFRGRNASNLFKLIPNLHLVLVDRWEPYEYDSEGVEKIDAELCKDLNAFKYHLNNKINKETALKILEKYKDRIEVYDMDSVEASKLVKNKYDFVFIDGDHAYESVKRDIEAWKDKVKSGGYLCGHDYGCSGFPGVKKAVDEHFPDAEIDKRNTWFVKYE